MPANIARFAFLAARLKWLPFEVYVLYRSATTYEQRRTNYELVQKVDKETVLSAVLIQMNLKNVLGHRHLLPSLLKSEGADNDPSESGHIDDPVRKPPTVSWCCLLFVQRLHSTIMKPPSAVLTPFASICQIVPDRLPTTFCFPSKKSTPNSCANWLKRWAATCS